MSAPAWLTARPIAHRGLHDVAHGVVENTLPAFEAAVAGNYAIELDVQPSADGEAVVFHDETLDRLTEGRGPVAALDLAALRSVRFKGTDARIPTLAEVLDAVAGRVPVLVEIKHEGRSTRQLEARAVEILRSYSGPVGLMSFEPESVEVMRALAPEILRGIISMRYDDAASERDIPTLRRLWLRHLLHAPRTRPQFISYDVRGLPSAGPLLLRRLGVPLLTWTVRRPEQVAVARRYADQIIFEGLDPPRMNPPAPEPAGLDPVESDRPSPSGTSSGR
jgi:glycerophosphoryl diester phosphodiesterase